MPRLPAPPPGSLRWVILLATFATSLAAQSPRFEMIETRLVEQGAPISLELVIYRPAGEGPFPTVVFNHGSTGSGTDPSLFTRTWHSPAVAEFFNARGWQVIFPQRRGRGRSGGLYDEGFGPNRAAGYTCDPARSLAGLERALTDLDEVVVHLRTRDDVDMSRLLASGWSRGGILAIAHAGTRAGVYRGAINFVGGWMSDGCTNPASINTVTFRRGGAFPGPTLWIYGTNDPFYSLTHSRSNFDAFTTGGGRGAFHVYDLGGGRSGHDIVFQPEQWGRVVEPMLAEFGRPATPPGRPGSAPVSDRLVNLSLRAAAEASPLIVGFVVAGTEPQSILLRGIGPALRRYGIDNPARAPSLVLYDAAGREQARASAWGGEAALATAFAATGAFPLDPAEPDAALLTSLAPGGYTLHISEAGTGGAGRILLGEIFAAGPPLGAGLANLSARLTAGAEGSAIAGFVIGGTTPARILVRVAGPALAAFGLNGVAADPRLAVFDATGQRIASNDDWSMAAGVFEEVGAFAFPTGSKDAATVLQLAPGAYTVHAESTTAGTALLEIYALP